MHSVLIIVGTCEPDNNQIIQLFDHVTNYHNLKLLEPPFNLLIIPIFEMLYRDVDYPENTCILKIFHMSKI